MKYTFLSKRILMGSLLAYRQSFKFPKALCKFTSTSGAVSVFASVLVQTEPFVIMMIYKMHMQYKSYPNTSWPLLPYISWPSSAMKSVYCIMSWMWNNASWCDCECDRTPHYEVNMKEIPHSMIHMRKTPQPSCTLWCHIGTMLYKPLIFAYSYSAFLDFCGNSRVVNLRRFSLMLSLL